MCMRVYVCVFLDGKVGDSFEVKTGVEQGCILASKLFAVFLAFMLRLTRDRLTEGIQINYRTDGKLLNLRRSHAKTKVSSTFAVGLHYADDASVNCLSEKTKQHAVNIFTCAYGRMGLSVNTNLLPRKQRALPRFLSMANS